MNITGGFLNSRKIVTAHGEKMRPTLSKTRQAVFNILAGLKDPAESSFLDLFAGSGIMAFEALSRGYKRVCAVEKNGKTASIIKQNAKILGVDIELIVSDAVKTPECFNDNFDFIYIDPPYESDLYEKVLDKIAVNGVSAPGGYVILEHPESIDVSHPKFTLFKKKKYSGKVISIMTPDF